MPGKKNKSKKGSSAPKQTSTTPPTESIAAGSSALRDGSSPVRGAPRSSSPSKGNDVDATPIVGPGGFPSTPASEDDKSFGINPMPAAPGAVNPIKLAPGEMIPESLTSCQDINEHVKLDKDSYEKSDALIGSDIQSQLPPVTKNMIPESSLPMGSGREVNINSVGPAATTAALAGAVPRETMVPDLVKKSQDEAGFAPEASAVPEEVREKFMLEKELQDKVQKAPATSQGTAGPDAHNTEHTGQAAGAATLAAGAAGAATMAAKHHSSFDKATSAGNDLKSGAAFSGGDFKSGVTSVSDDFRSGATSTSNDLRSGATNTASDFSDSAKQKAPEPVHGSLVTGLTKDDARNTAPSAGPPEAKDSAFDTREAPEAGATSSSALSKQPTEAEFAKDVKHAPAVEERTSSKAAAHDARPTEAKLEAPKTLQTSAFGAPRESTSDVAKATQSQTSELPTYESQFETAQGNEAKAVEAKADDAKLAETTTGDTKPAESKPAETKAEESTPEAPKLTEAAAAEPTLDPAKPQEATAETTGAAATNGSGTKHSGSTGSPAEATPERKKKNRLSTIFTKIKEKLSDKK